MKKIKNSGIVIVFQIFVLFIFLSNSAIGQQALEGDYLIDLIGKNIKDPEIKAILKNRDYQFKDKNKTNIYSSIERGISLQFSKSSGTLVNITLAHDHYSMDEFNDKLPGGYNWNNILDAKEMEWRKSTYGTPMIGRYKDVELVLTYKSENNFGELKIEMIEYNPIVRGEGEKAPDHKIKKYPSEVYQGDFFCEIIGKNVTDSDVAAFLTNRDLNIKVEDYPKNNREYVSYDFGFRIYSNNDVVYKVKLTNNYYKSDLYRGLLPSDVSFDNVFKSEKIVWLLIDEKYQTIYKNCRMEVEMAKNGTGASSMLIDKEVGKIERYFEGGFKFPDGDEWIDLFARHSSDKKVQKLFNNKANGFVYDEYNKSWTSKDKGVRIYMTNSGYIGSIYLFNVDKSIIPYKGTLPGGTNFSNVLSSGKISYKPNGNSYEAIFDNYKLAMWSSDGKTIDYFSVDKVNIEAVAKNSDGTWSKTRMIPATNTDSYSSTNNETYKPEVSIDDLSTIYVTEFVKGGATFVKKHSVRQVGGGGYYTTRFDFNMLTGSKYVFCVIYTHEGVSKLDMQLSTANGYSLNINPDLSKREEPFAIKSFLVETLNTEIVTCEATLFFSDDYKIDRDWKDIDILVFRKEK
ncbi:MAG TPA: hypothetical protein PKN32_12945 [Bacteroidales bacterium]|nr:hypothetical protein [Bacteroidales bacterium]